MKGSQKTFGGESYVGDTYVPLLLLRKGVRFLIGTAFFFSRLSEGTMLKIVSLPVGGRGRRKKLEIQEDLVVINIYMLVRVLVSGPIICIARLATLKPMQMCTARYYTALHQGTQ